MRLVIDEVSIAKLPTLGTYSSWELFLLTISFLPSRPSRSNIRYSTVDRLNRLHLWTNNLGDEIYVVPISENKSL